MYTELKKLDESLNRCFIMLFDAQTKGITWWMAGDGFDPTNHAYHVPYSEHPPQLAYLKGWEERQEKWHYIMEGEEKKAWDEYLFTATELIKLPLHVIQYMRFFEKIHLSASFSNFGCLTTGSFQPLSDASFSILIRFAKVFDLTYTRSLDLQKAEAQAVQAAKDLIKIKAARKKAEDTLAALKATQAQLIQSEKMASLGELTAGIAHEIQNPLNFVNNFSETNVELLDEVQMELQAGNQKAALTLLTDVKENEQKINLHGKRAEAIVKSMLQHSRKNTAEKQLTDINALAEEYLRLAYHGFRAKDKSFHATIQTHFDENISKIDLLPQDIGRVLLNLFNNAFYAVHEQMKKSGEGYEPTVCIATNKSKDKIEIRVRDNGMGISNSFQEKIFQPFFTTKPAGQGTGLGLSLSYDIVKAHGGELKVDSTEGKGAAFAIFLPASM
jgi:signal transduction histidine kinase